MMLTSPPLQAIPVESTVQSSLLQSTSAQPITEHPPPATLPVVTDIIESMVVTSFIYVPEIVESVDAVVTDTTSDGVLAMGSASESEGGGRETQKGVSMKGALIRLSSDDMSSVGMMSATHPSYPESYGSRYDHMTN